MPHTLSGTTIADSKGSNASHRATPPPGLAMIPQRQPTLLSRAEQWPDLVMCGCHMTGTKVDVKHIAGFTEATASLQCFIQRDPEGLCKNEVV